MRRIVIGLIMFLLPSRLAFPLVKFIGGGIFYAFGRGSRVGFSLILASSVRLGEGANIRSGNLIVVEKLELREKARIKSWNVLKGRFDVQLGKDAVINKQNKITSSRANVRKSELVLGVNSIIGVNHMIDLVESVHIGNHSILAGSGSQLWTHGFYHSKQGPERWRVDGGIDIGRNVYLGTRCIVTAGVRICDAVTVGAGTVVAKSLDKSGLYVGQKLYYKEFDPDEAIQRFCSVTDHIYERKSVDTDNHEEQGPAI